MLLPKLSAYQTLENSQGTLDPLGLYLVSDRLALRLVPGLRERMTHPRFLTAIAVGAVICQDFDKNLMAVDEISAPWQVYEWIVVSAFIRHFGKDQPNLTRGLPGRDKTTQALINNLPLSASRYLKTASVFGFHGVYRTLSRNIRLMDNGYPGETAIELLRIWEQEQDMQGFVGGQANTPGGRFRKALFAAVDESLGKGEVAKPWSWNLYPQIAEKLVQSGAGPKEKDFLFQTITAEPSSGRTEIIRFLQTREGQEALANGSEKDFHVAFLGHTQHNRDLILAIQQYEQFARLLYNAFYEMLQFMEDHQHKASLKSLEVLELVNKAADGFTANFEKLLRLLEPFSEERLLTEEQFEGLRDFHSTREWIQLLFEHHYRIQKNKPPNGKAPWLLEYSPGNYILAAGHALDQELSEEYVHQYRTRSLNSFVNDLTR